MKVYFAADHGAFDFKNALLAYVQDELKMEVEDCGAFTMEPGDDYPVIIAGAAKKLSPQTQVFRARAPAQTSRRRAAGC